MHDAFFLSMESPTKRAAIKSIIRKQDYHVVVVEKVILACIWNHLPMINRMALVRAFPWVRPLFPNLFTEFYETFWNT